MAKKKTSEKESQMVRLAFNVPPETATSGRAVSGQGVALSSSSLRGNLRHCDVLYVRLIPQVLRASNLEPLLCHRFSRHYYSCYEFINVLLKADC